MTLPAELLCELPSATRLTLCALEMLLGPASRLGICLQVCGLGGNQLPF